MNEVWFARSNNALIPTDEDSQKVIAKLEQGECQAFEVLGIRDPVSFRRYWVLMTLAAKHVKRIEIDRDRATRQPVYLTIRDKEDASDAMKFCTGHFDTLPVGSTDYAIRKLRSISYAKMTPEQWNRYLPPVFEALLDKVVPFIEVPEARDEICRSIERWQEEAEARAA
jgi:hypothetical protein